MPIKVAVKQLKCLRLSACPIADNLRMVQGTQCQHAIQNYMRKVKLKYQHVMSILYSGKFPKGKIFRNAKERRALK